MNIDNITNTETVDTADLDCIYLTYGEPQAEEFWVKIQNLVPWATRVDGIKGSDAAHKAAADASTTDRFILIDGDNMPDPEFFNLTVTVPNKPTAHRWKARNHINGLMYGNGGLSMWHKDFVYNMKTHEASNGDPETAVEFCFDPDYHAMYDCYSTTYPNKSPEQAWRAGFREGIKMCLDRGKKPTLEEFKEKVHKRNLDHLCIWMSIGADVENGDYARAGAMLATHLTMIGDHKGLWGFEDFQYEQVQDFDKLSDLWNTYSTYTVPTFNGQHIILKTLEDFLTLRLNLPINTMDANASAFFKRHYNSSFSNKGPSVTELDVIRKIEGW